MLIKVIIKEYIIQYIENGVVAQKNIFRHFHWLLRSFSTVRLEFPTKKRLLLMSREDGEMTLFSFYIKIQFEKKINECAASWNITRYISFISLKLIYKKMWSSALQLSFHFSLPGYPDYLWLNIDCTPSNQDRNLAQWT